MEVDRHHELASFLRAKRAQVNVEQTPLAHGGSRRRVPGLRREEVAELAHISLTYYTRLERGKVPSISGAVLDGLVGALRLSPDERAYITSLIPISEELTRRSTRDGLGAQEALMRRFLDDLGPAPPTSWTSPAPSSSPMTWREPSTGSTSTGPAGATP